MDKHIEYLKDARISALTIGNIAHRLCDEDEAQFWHELDEKLALAIERLKKNQ
jgi:hypothetical protein